MHWITHYLGRGGLDCWGLVRVVYQDQFGITLPEIAGIAQASLSRVRAAVEQEEGSDWRELAAPRDGCVVAMSQSQAIHHVGVYAEADGGKVVHYWQTDRVIADTFRGLRLKGFQTIKFYRHLSLWPT